MTALPPPGPPRLGPSHLDVLTSTVVIVSCLCLAKADAPLPDAYHGAPHPESFGAPLPDVYRGAPPIQYSTLSGPAFLNASATVNVVAGTTAMIPCGVRNLHNYTVSWVRGRDIRLLTTGPITYTSDSRFVSVNPSHGQQWILKIHYVKMSDAGTYLCQVSTTPPITLSLNLTVQEAVAKVLPGSDVYVQTGSRLEVVCQVEGCPPPALLSWTRDGRPVQTLAPRDPSQPAHLENTTTPVTSLTLARAKAQASDSGTYSCSSTCTQPVNVTVHVLRGEELAAMQHQNTAPHTTTTMVPSVVVALAVWWWRCGGGGGVREALLGC